MFKLRMVLFAFSAAFLSLSMGNLPPDPLHANIDATGQTKEGVSLLQNSLSMNTPPDPTAQNALPASAPDAFTSIDIALSELDRSLEQSRLQLAELEDPSLTYDAAAPPSASSSRIPAATVAASPTPVDQADNGTTVQSGWISSARNLHNASALLLTLQKVEPEEFQKIVDEFEMNASHGFFNFIWNFLTGVLFYLLVGQYYLNNANVRPNNESRDLQALSPIGATCQASCSTVCHSLCCPSARLSLTLATLGMMNYWLALILSIWSPCLVLCCANACTDLNVYLGGQRQNPISALLCTCFCWCCVITQDAESLDRALGVKGSVIGPPVRVA